MKKNIVIVINPVSKNIMKAIYNAIIVDLLEIIIIGDRKIIYALCLELNINIEFLQIVNLVEMNNINKKIEEYKNFTEIKGIIIDDNLNGNIFKEIKTNHICNIIDYGVFLKSVFLINLQTDYLYYISEVMNVINNLNIKNYNIGIVLGDKAKTNQLKKEIKKYFNAKTDIISIKKIKSCKYSIIIFEDKLMERQYINTIKDKIYIRNIEIKKASNVYIFDAKNKSLNTIFLQILFLSKIDKISNEINTKII